MIFFFEEFCFDNTVIVVKFPRCFDFSKHNHSHWGSGLRMLRASNVVEKKKTIHFFTPRTIKEARWIILQPRIINLNWCNAGW